MIQKLGLWANIQHTPKSSSNWRVNQNWCKTSGKMFTKWTKTGIFTYLGAQSRQKIGLLGAHILHTSKSTYKGRVKQYWCESSENLWENDQRPEFCLILRPKMSPKLGLWGPYSTHHWNYLQWACEAILMWNQWKLLGKWPKSRNLMQCNPVIIWLYKLCHDEMTKTRSPTP